jgi:hypothetical protein
VVIHQVIEVDTAEGAEVVLVEVEGLVEGVEVILEEAEVDKFDLRICRRWMMRFGHCRLSFVRMPKR